MASFIPSLIPVTIQNVTRIQKEPLQAKIKQSFQFCEETVSKSIRSKHLYSLRILKKSIAPYFNALNVVCDLLSMCHLYDDGTRRQNLALENVKK